MRLSKSKREAIKRNKDSMAVSNVSVKKSTMDMVDKKIMLIAAAVFALAMVVVVAKAVKKSQLVEETPDNYYKLTHLYDSEVEDFSEPINPVENEVQLEQEINASDTDVVDAKNLTPIACWGDSFTVADNTNSLSYASVLADLSGRLVYNIGIENESIKSLAGRQGGVPMYATPFIIPSDKTPVEISIDSAVGGRLSFDFQKNAGLNPCTINGVQGMISVLDGKLHFTRSNSGSEVMVYEPAQVITRGMELRRRDISIFFIGSDSSFTDTEMVVKIYRDMANYLQGDKEFLVVGPVKGQPEVLTKLENALEKEFGEKFLNVRKQLCEEALIEHDEYSLPLEEINNAKNGIVPPSYFANSNNNFSAYGSFAIGSAIHTRLGELGYYDD